MMRRTRRRETPGMLSGKLPVAVWGLKVTNGGRDARSNGSKKVPRRRVVRGTEAWNRESDLHMVLVVRL